MDTIDVIYDPGGEEDMIIGFQYNICDTHREMKREVIKRDIKFEFDFYGICGHPTMYCAYDRNTVNIQVPIFLNREDFEEGTLWHETYHGLKMIQHILDFMDTGHKYSNEETVADITGVVIEEARKKVLKSYRK